MSIAVLSWRNDNARNMSSKFHSWLDLNLTALKESKSLRRQKVNVCPWIMACLDKYSVFLGPGASHYCHHKPLSVTACFEDRHRRTDGHRGSWRTPGIRQPRLISAPMTFFIVSPRKLSSKQGHWCLETFSQKSFDRTQSIQDGLSSHKLLKTNI